MARIDRGPVRARSPRPLRLPFGSLALGVIAATLVVAGGIGEVVLLYSGATQSSGARSPLRLADGGSYASVSAEGFVSVSYSTAQQVGFSATVRGANGAFGSYLLDVLEVQAVANTTTGWHLRFDVTRALVATGANAVYLFYCTAGPSGVPDSGSALANGVDAAGDVWAVYAPICSGTQGSVSLLATATGATIAFPGLVFGTTLLYLSFAVDLSSAGSTTTTSATLVLVADSP